MKFRPIWTLSLLITAASCAEVNQLRDAQDAFNRAAAAENAHRLGMGAQWEGNGSEGMANWTVQQAGYASALESLNDLEEDSSKRNSLVQDGLWGTALSLKAMCQWRLGQTDQALKTAREAQKLVPDQIYPRDRAMLEALPGLIMIDQGYAKTLKKKQEFPSKITLEEIQKLLVDPDGAVGIIGAARKMVDPNHPLQVYFIQAQLAAYRNFRVAYQAEHPQQDVPDADDSHITAKRHLADLKGFVSSQQEGIELVAYWARLCNLPPPP